MTDNKRGKGRPALSTTGEKSKHVSFRIPEDDLAHIREAAKQGGQTFSQYIRAAALSLNSDIDITEITQGKNHD